MVGTAWLADSARAVMIAEANQSIPNETGGILLGYWAVPRYEVVITAIIGPGPIAYHAPHWFVPDADYQEAEVARYYRLAPGCYTYLGDWHSHPFGGMELSWLDRATLREIAAYPDARAPLPLMAILYPAGGSNTWEFAVWCYNPSPWLTATGHADASLLRIRLFLSTRYGSRDPGYGGA